MSYDVEIQDAAGKELWWRNYTSNSAPMWREAGIDLREFHGKSTDELADALIAPIDVMTADPDRFQKHVPENRWGTVPQTIRFLTEVRDECLARPGQRVRVGF